MASVVKNSRSPFYWARFRDASGREFTRSTRQSNKEQALELAYEMERQARSGILPEQGAPQFPKADLTPQRPPPVSETALISGELVRFLSSSPNQAEATRKRYEQIARQFINFLGSEYSQLPLVALTSKHVEGYKRSRLDFGISGNSVNIDLKFLRSFCKLAVEEGRLVKNVAAEIPFEPEEESPRKPFTYDQIRALLRACHDIENGDDWKGSIALSFSTGTRLWDITNLHRKNLILNRWKPYLSLSEEEEEVEGTNEHRFIRQLLYEFLTTRAVPGGMGGYLFPSLANRKTGGAQGLSSEFRLLMTAAGIERHPKESLMEGEGTGCDLSEYSLQNALNADEIETIISSAFRYHPSLSQKGERPANETPPPYRLPPDALRWSTRVI